MKEAVSFKELLRKKKALIIPVVLFFLLFYFGLPLSVWLFPEMMEYERGPFHLPWWWVYAFLQLIITWFLGWIYWVKAKGFDKMVEKIKQGNDE